MKEKFKNIEILRFIFAVLIMMFHYAKNCSLTKPLIEQSCLKGIIYQSHHCVDFFFIIAGFFLFLTINITQPTFEFAKKRFLRLAPLLWLYVFFQFLLSILIHTDFTFDGSILKLFLLNNIGFAPNTGGSIFAWFIASLFWVSLFYFYIAKILNKKYLNLFVWLITICSLGISLNCTEKQIFYFINTGIIRGLYGMGIGYFISEVYKSGFMQNCSKKFNHIASTLEIFCIGFLTYYMLFSKSLPGKSGFVYIVIFSILFYLFLIRKGFISKLFNNDLSVKLGSYSYSIYVMHILISTIFNKIVYIETNTFVMNHIILTYTIEVITGVAFGILIHYIFEKPINKLIHTKLAKNKVL